MPVVVVGDKGVIEDIKLGGDACGGRERGVDDGRICGLSVEEPSGLAPSARTEGSAELVVRGAMLPRDLIGAGAGDCTLGVEDVELLPAWKGRMSE